jgi:NADP-dependent 3-hydroxy acid dehydrogenase YdfG
MTVAGKVVLVTGATSGIGLAIARLLALKGMVVFGCGRRSDRLREITKEISTSGGCFMPIECNLRNTEDIAAMFERIRAHSGGVDVLINNAGLGHKAPLISGDTEAWREMLEVNVIALSICTREAVADMRLRGDEGYVIHISSMSAHRVPSSSGMYSASKFAVRSLTEGLRQELRAIDSRIRVSAISPGFVETEFAERYSGSKEIALQTYSRYKVLEAEDIAKQALFLLETPIHMEVHDVLMRPTEQPN